MSEGSREQQELMRQQFFGDSYDIVKKSLIAWLSDFGQWVTHPMFTEAVKPGEAAAFLRLVGTPLLTELVLTPQTNRREYFSLCRTAGNLFLDPDTGVCLEPRRDKKSINYVFGPKLVDWCGLRPRALTLIFDQSYSRGSKDGIREKLAYFADKKVYGFAYNSHATFLLLATDSELVEQARERLLELSGLPASRLVSVAKPKSWKTGVRPAIFAILNRRCDAVRLKVQENVGTRDLAAGIIKQYRSGND
jgi:hypothetical protein